MIEDSYFFEDAFIFTLLFFFSVFLAAATAQPESFLAVELDVDDTAATLGILQAAVLRGLALIEIMEGS